MKQISGRSAFLSLLEDEGITYLFGNPGTTELPIMDALRQHPDLHYVLGLQESIVVAMADGYARASGRLAACNVHVAPGLGNAMGAIYNAKWFGSPVLISAGQQEQGHGLTEPLLYDPLLPIAQPLVKWAVEVTRLEDLPRIMHRAAKIALSPPTGPVFISLPGDILNAEAALNLGQPTRISANTRPDDITLARLADRLLAANNPVIVAGHELATHNALDEAAALAELLGAPVYQQTVPYGAHFHSEQPTFMGSLGRNQTRVRQLLEPYDLLILLGADQLRMSVWQETDPLPPHLTIVQIGERAWELGKNYPAELAICANIKTTLTALQTLLLAAQSPTGQDAAQKRLQALEANNWTHRRAKLIRDISAQPQRAPIDPHLLMLRIVEALPQNAVIVEEALTSAQSLLSLYPLRDHQCYFGLASGGIGFAIAGVIGIQLALPERPVLAIIGDGSAMYSIQALWTAAHLKLPITYVIANNRSYRILKERLLAYRGNDQFIGMNFQQPEIDFVALAQSMGVTAVRIEQPEAIAPALREALAHNGPYLLDVRVDDGFSA